MASATSQSCRLLRLPVEARLNIYHYLFHGPKAFLDIVYETKDDKTSVTTVLSSEDCHKSVLFVCKQVYVEAKRILADSVSLIVISDSLNTSPDLCVPWSDQLDEYLFHVRELWLEERNPCKLKIDMEALPNLKKVTYSDIYLIVNFSPDVSSDAEAIAWLKGEHDQELVKTRLESVINDRHRRMRTDPFSRCSVWFHEQLGMPNRVYQLLKEDLYDVEIIKREDGRKVDLINPQIRLTFNVETHAVISRLTESCHGWKGWSKEVIELCASINRDSETYESYGYDSDDEGQE